MVVIMLLFIGSVAQAQVVYVDQSATGNGDGASWANAVTDLQAAIDLAATVASASSPMQVWVKTGTYKPTTGTDQTIRFEVKNYVEMYGGFDGTETAIGQRDIGKNPTIISGDIGVMNDRTDNSGGLLVIDAGVNGPIVFNGFTFDGAYDPSNLSTMGIISPETGASPTELTYTNCTFSNNEIGFGSVGGFGTSYPMRFYHCKFLDNLSVPIFSSGTLEVLNSLFTGNNNSIYIYGGVATVSNCTFADNSGYGIYLQNQGTPIVSSIKNNIFWGNSGTDISVNGNASTNLTAANNLLEDSFSFGTNTISADPQFFDAADGDLRIKNCSPAVDQGDNSVLPVSFTNDLGGNGRTFNGTIDLGAYENQITPVSFSAVEVGHVTCNGDATGQISVNGAGGSGATLTYSIDGVNFQASGLFENLGAGSYHVYVKDPGTDCVYSESYDITEPDPISIDLTITQKPSSLEATIDATGGSSPFAYSMDGTNYQSGNTFVLGSGNSFTAYVKDGNNCVKALNFFVSNEGNRVLFVNQQAAGLQDGSSWANGLRNLQEAIDLAAEGMANTLPVQVWVKEDTYYPTVSQSGTDRNASFVMKNEVEIYGGFNGTETLLTQRDWKSNETILSGDIGTISVNTDNSNHIIFNDYDVLPPLGKSAVLDGFVVEDGYLDSGVNTDGGAGMKNINASPTVRNTTFRNNVNAKLPVAPGFTGLNGVGGAVRNTRDSSPDFISCIFHNNVANQGGAIAYYELGAVSTMERASVVNCLFYDNEAVSSASAVYFSEKFLVDFHNNTLVNNVETGAGAASATSFPYYSGAFIYRVPSGAPKFENNIIWGNTSPVGSYQLWFRFASGLTIRSNLVEGGVDGFKPNDVGLPGNIVDLFDFDPQFTDPSGDDYSLDYCSPAVDAGLTAGLPTFSTTDVAGKTRVFNSVVDLGAYEETANLKTEISLLEVVDVSCNGNSDGQVTVTASSSFTPITYSLDDVTYGSNAVLPGLGSGSYTVYAKDANGCIDSEDFTVNEPAVVTVNISGHTDISCSGEDDGTISGSITGGTGTFVVSVDGTNFDTTPITDVFSIDDLTPGTYTVTAKDENGCIGTSATVVIDEPSALSMSLSSDNLTCFNDASGTITITASGGTGTLEYSLDGSTFQIFPEFGGLAAGSYTAYARDANGCLATDNITLTQPLEVTASASPAAASCQGSADGSITISTTNGTPPFSYSLDGGSPQTSNVFDQLNPGTYSVKVTDANGCGPTVAGIVVGADVVITPDITTTHVVCAGDASGSVSIAAAGGLAPYQFSLNGGDFQTGSEFTGLVAGTYDVTVKDANGCTATGTATISEPGAIAVSNLAVTNLSCNGDGGGAVVAEASGGTGALTFSIDGNNFQSENAFSGLAAGNYTLTIADEAGCTKSEEIVVTEPAAFTAEALAASVSCFGASDGSLTVSVTGPEANAYTYSIDGENFQEAATFAGLPAAVYTVVVKNQSGCTQSVQATLSQPAQLVLEAEVVHTTCGQANGSVAASASGGTGSYVFSLNGEDFVSEAAFGSLPAGDHVVTVRDDSGCTAEAAVTINSSSTMTLTTSDNDGHVTVTVEGGTAPYQYSAGGGFQDSNEFNLEPGDYTITVKDAAGCEATADLTIDVETGVSGQLLTSTFLAYPNPASAELWFASEEIRTVSIYDLSGTRVLRVDNYQTRESIDLTHLRPGMVIIELELHNNERLNQRLIIQR